MGTNFLFQWPWEGSLHLWRLTQELPGKRRGQDLSSGWWGTHWGRTRTKSLDPSASKATRNCWGDSRGKGGSSAHFSGLRKFSFFSLESSICWSIFTNPESPSVGTQHLYLTGSSNRLVTWLARQYYPWMTNEGRLRPREVMWLAQGHTAREGQSLGSDSRHSCLLHSPCLLFSPGACFSCGFPGSFF